MRIDVLTGATYEMVTPGVRPHSRSDHGAAWDPVGRAIYVFGGRGPEGINAGYHHDLWRYFPDEDRWEEVRTGTESPGSRSDMAMAWDTWHGQLLIFGGVSGGGHYGDLWAYRPIENQWVPLTLEGTKPAARGYPMGVWDSTHGKFLVYGGWTQDETFAKVLFKEVWAYDPATASWVRYDQPAPYPSLRSKTRILWDETGARLLLIAGEVSESSQFDSPHLENQVWAWTLERNSWTLLEPGNAPPPRYQAAVTIDAFGRPILIGGYCINRYCGDVWALDLRVNSWVTGGDFAPDLPELAHHRYLPLVAR